MRYYDVFFDFSIFRLFRSDVDAISCLLWYSVLFALVECMPLVVSLYILVFLGVHDSNGYYEYFDALCHSSWII